MTYDVVLLVEQTLTETDAAQIRSLHEGIEDSVVYHVLLPVDDAATRVEAAMAALPTTEYLGTATMAHAEVDLDAVEKEARRAAADALAETLGALRNIGATAHGTLVTDPVEGLVAKVAEVDGREAIVLTRPHVVAEFFHVDWTARARHKLGVPVLHLLEHENFDGQAGEGEGINGF